MFVIVENSLALVLTTGALFLKGEKNEKRRMY